jgi:hypothetical protein
VPADTSLRAFSKVFSFCQIFSDDFFG